MTEIHSYNNKNFVINIDYKNKLYTILNPEYDLLLFVDKIIIEANKYNGIRKLNFIGFHVTHIFFSMSDGFKNYEAIHIIFQYICIGSIDINNIDNILKNICIPHFDKIRCKNIILNIHEIAKNILVNDNSKN